MKKVFAFLSVLLLTIACVGLTVKNTPAKAAAGKFTVDTTLAEDEIPVYIMDSIMTTFPNYYDNDAKPDSNWQGAARMYPWNETRLRIAQLDEKGQPTGKYYAIYFAGHTVATESNGEQVLGAGKNILFWNVDANGNVVAEKYSDGKKASGGQASDPSLSHMRTNKSGQDITVDPTLASVGLGDGEGTNFYNRSVVFDGQGRIIRGVALDAVYSSAAAAAGEVKFAPEYCRVNGVVTKIADGVVCDKAKVEQLDENGETVRDENGDPVMVESDKDDLIYSRFVWEFFTEQPTNVNTVPYLSQGWDAMLWDYCYPVEGGYMAIAFVGSADNTAHVVKGDQVEPYKATLVARYVSEGMTEQEAAAKAEKEVTAARACVKELRIPAGGFTFDYGYLDRGKAICDEAFNSTVINGYLYGRTLLTKKDRNGNPVTDEEGNEVKIGMAEQRTYNFSVSDVKYDDKVANGTSYRLVTLPAAGLNVVEVMQGDVFTPVNNINYNGVMRYWNTLDDLQSFKSDNSALDLYITESVNGGAALVAVEPSNAYTSMKAITDDFLADIAKWKGVDVSEIKFDTAANFQSNFSWGQFFPTNADNAGKLDYPSAELPSFWNIPENRAKWSWLIEKIYQTMNTYPGGDTYTASLNHVQTAMNSYYCGSPQTIAYAFWYFLNEQTHGYFGFNFGDGHSSEWIDSRTNLEKWNDYKIDATTKAVGDNWTVTYTVKNRETDNSSSLTVKYVVVDSYTPVITYDTGKLRYVPRKVGDSYVIDAINPYEIVKAYDGQYNGVDILGNDITQNVTFNTDLNFAKPTEGKYEVVATIKNNAGTKEASVKFVINVVDVTAPMVATRTVTIQQGQDFDPRDGITVAYDNVDGNLFDVDYEWWYQTNPARAVDTNNLNGTDRTIAISVEVSDRSGNATEVRYNLVIIANKTYDKALSDLDKKVTKLQDSIDEALDAIDAVQETLDEITTKVNSMDAKISAINSAVEEVKKNVNDTMSSVNATKTAVETSESEIKKAIDSVLANTDEIQSSVDTVQGSVDTLNATVASVKTAVEERKKSGCNSGALIALGLSTVIAAMAVVLKKRH